MLSSRNAYFITCTLQIFQVKVNKNKYQWFGKLGIQLFVYLLKFLAHSPGEVFGPSTDNAYGSSPRG